MNMISICLLLIISNILLVDGFSTNPHPLSLSQNKHAKKKYKFTTSYSGQHNEKVITLLTPSVTSSSLSATTSSTSAKSTYKLTPLESWCITHMDVWYSQSLSLKCPFMRRRMADILDGVDMIMRFLVIRHKSLDIIGPPPGCRAIRVPQIKQSGLNPNEILTIIQNDWKPHNHKGYYITGRLNSTIYRDDCLFDGPDPDMPVRGLRKYLNAASQLFEHADSSAELISIKIIKINDDNVIVARWKLQGVLHLPWRPKLPSWTGETRYHIDNDGLIYYHEESWDISVFQAFMETLWPDAATIIWGKDGNKANNMK